MYLELCTENQLCDFLAEFGATKESFRQDVHNLMQWIEKQPHLPNIKGKNDRKNYKNCYISLFWHFFQVHNLISKFCE